MKRFLPWMLVAALVGAVAYGVTSSAPAPERMSAVPAPPLAEPSPGERSSDGEEDQEPGAMPGETPSQATLTGVVREHHDVSQYTYLRLDTGTDAGEAWAAVYRAPVKDGTKVTIERASPLRHFHSRELGRDFDTIWFGMLPGYETAPAASAVSLSAAAADAGRAAPRHAAPVAGALSIAELARTADALEGKQVAIAGHVVKENDGIMGRNWIHVQDGTGSAADGSNDVLVTSDATAKVGDEVLATGTVRTKQDFGSGYAYKFMLEKASVGPPPGR